MSLGDDGPLAPRRELPGAPPPPRGHLARRPSAARSSGWPAWRAAGSAPSCAASAGLTPTTDGTHAASTAPTSARATTARASGEASATCRPVGSRRASCEGLYAQPSTSSSPIAAATGFFIDWRRATETAREPHRRVRHQGSARLPGRSPLRAATSSACSWPCCPERLRVLLMEHPTRGLDIESADWVWTRLLARRDQGTAIIFASADLDELLRYSDRILVFYSGRVLAELDRPRHRPGRARAPHRRPHGAHARGPRLMTVPAPAGPALPATRAPLLSGSGARSSRSRRSSWPWPSRPCWSSSPARTRSRRSSSSSRARWDLRQDRRHDHGLGAADARGDRSRGHVRGRPVEHRRRGPDRPGRHRRGVRGAQARGAADRARAR